MQLHLSVNDEKFSWWFPTICVSGALCIWYYDELTELGLRDGRGYSDACLYCTFRYPVSKAALGGFLKEADISYVLKVKCEL